MLLALSLVSFGFSTCCAAERVRFRVGRGVDELLVRGEAAQCERRRTVGLPQRDLVAGADDVAPVGFEVPIRRDGDRPARVVRAVVGIGFGDAIVMHLADGDERGEFRRAAEMIDVKVRGHEVIDLLQPRDLGRHLVDAARIALERIAGIDEDRFARRRHDERRAAAFHIHPVDVERAIREAGVCGGGQQEGEADRGETSEGVVHGE